MWKCKSWIPNYFTFILGPRMTPKLNVKMIGMHSFLWHLKKMKLLLNFICVRAIYVGSPLRCMCACVCVCAHVHVHTYVGRNFSSNRLKNIILHPSYSNYSLLVTPSLAEQS